MSHYLRASFPIIPWSECSAPSCVLVILSLVQVQEMAYVLKNKLMHTLPLELELAKELYHLFFLSLTLASLLRQLLMICVPWNVEDHFLVSYVTLAWMNIQVSLHSQPA